MIISRYLGKIHLYKIEISDKTVAGFADFFISVPAKENALRKKVSTAQEIDESSIKMTRAVFNLTVALKIKTERKGIE